MIQVVSITTHQHLILYLMIQVASKFRLSKAKSESILDYAITYQRSTGEI